MKKYNLQCPIRKANPYRRMAKAMSCNGDCKNLPFRIITVETNILE